MKVEAVAVDESVGYHAGQKLVPSTALAPAAAGTAPVAVRCQSRREPREDGTEQRGAALPTQLPKLTLPGVVVVETRRGYVKACRRLRWWRRLVERIVRHRIRTIRSLVLGIGGVSRRTERRLGWLSYWARSVTISSASPTEVGLRRCGPQWALVPKRSGFETTVWDGCSAGYHVLMSDDNDRPAPDVAFEFEHDDTAPGRARRALRPLFPQPDRLADDVGLVASELVSNVIRHTDDGGHLHAWDDDRLRLEVHDTDPTLPVPAGYGDQRGGHGLRIVDEVADGWGAHLDGTGKTLWAEFQRPTEEDVPPSAGGSKPLTDAGELEQPSDASFDSREL